MGSHPPTTGNALRREIHLRNLARVEAAQGVVYESTFGPSPCVLYREDDSNTHGNFLPASYRRISANTAWTRRLRKSYTSASRLPRPRDFVHAELDCASSSDALLMNIFCYPRVLHRPQLCSLLGIDLGLQPEFGVRASLAMQRNEVDRTEIDMRLGPLLVEAKLTESGFGTASRERLLRYVGVDETFDLDELPWTGNKVHGYQLIRGLLAADATDGRFVMLCDGRRADLTETGFRVLKAVRRYDLRSRLLLLSWQELASTLPPTMQEFLAEKYGIIPRN